MLSKVSPKNKLKLLVLVIALAILAYFLVKTDIHRSITPEAIQAYSNRYGNATPLIFIAIFSIATVILIPGTPFSIAGGLIFGSALGTIYVIIGATIGASLTFLIARFFGANLVNNFLESPRFSRLKYYDEALSSRGFISVLILRLIPLFPFNGLNFTLGLTKVSFREYVLGTLVGMIPGTIVLTLLGDSIASLSPAKIFLAILLFIGLTIIASKLAKKSPNDPTQP